MPAPSLRAIVLALAIVLAAGCARPPKPAEPTAALERAGTVLILTGSAFATPAAREEARALLAQTTGRPARVLAEEPAMEHVTQPAASRLDRTVARAAATDARDARCRKQTRSIVAAVAERGDAVLRIRLDAKTTARPATDREREQLGRKAGAAGILSAIGVGVGDTLYETTLTGQVERTTFPAETATARRKIHHVIRALARSDETPPPRVGEAVAAGLAAMRAPAPTKWDAVARGLVSRGCPVLATAVADAFLDDGAARRRIRAAAIGVLTGRGTPEPAPVAPAEPEVAIGPEEPPPPDPSADADPAGTEPTCAALCSLQMVQLCNNDRALWSRHGSRWESTRCGARRSETFLADCYRMQWLSGTYDRSCMRPCEQTTDGRLRLAGLLRRSGCSLRPTASTTNGNQVAQTN
jgi:hypothetical protein